MNKKKWGIYIGSLIVLLLAMGSCVTPFTPDLNKEDSKPLLVVEGQVTDQEGPFRIKLTKSARLGYSTASEPVLNANVSIIDDLGHNFRLYHIYNEIYETAEKKLKAIPGNTYTLMITTPDDGLQYSSMPVLMQEVPDIDSLYFEQVTHSRITEGKAYEENWVNIRLDAHDASGNTRYWRWEYVETFEGLRRLSEFSWLRCWVTIPSASVLVASTAGKPVNELKGIIVRPIGPGNPQLYARYSILVKQYSIDQDLYNYWNQLKDVSENSGGIYSKMPAQVYGNITCCDGKSKALGYFASSAVKEKRFFISRADNYQMETSQFFGTCTSDKPPSYW